MSRSAGACLFLAEELKALRERTGLSFVELGAKTHYSKSSWSRYLKGEALPPWKAVQALCGLAGEAEPRLRVMWELAEQEWSRRGTVGAGAAGGAGAAVADRVAGRAIADALNVGTLPQTAVATRVATVQLEAVPPAAARSAAVSSPAVPTVQPATPSRWHKPFPCPPGWVCMVIGIVVASAVFGIASWYRSGGPAPSSGVSCVGAACDGLDAGPTFCGGAPTPLGTWSVQDDTELDVRYSAACRSAWGRVWHGAVGGRVSISLAGKDTRSAVVRNLSESTDFVYTMMVPAVTRGAMLQVCWTPVEGAASCRSVAVP